MSNFNCTASSIQVEEWEWPVGKRRDDKARCVAEIFVLVAELCVANIREAILLLIVPSMSQLWQPCERLRILDFLQDEFADDITIVYLYRADRHDLLAVITRQLADQQDNHRIQLRYLLNVNKQI